MVLDKKVTGRAASMPVGLFTGLVVSMGATVLCISLVVTMILAGRLPEAAIGYCGMFMIPLSVAVGALVCVLMVKRRRLFASLGVGILYILSLAAISAVFFGGARQGIVPAVVMTFVGALVVGLWGLRGKEKGRAGRKKYLPR